MYLRVSLISCHVLDAGYAFFVCVLCHEANLCQHVPSNREHGHFVLAILSYLVRAVHVVSSDSSTKHKIHRTAWNLTEQKKQAK